MKLSGIDQWLSPTEQVNVTNCDREPIHIPGSVQGHGALVVLDASGAVCQASANAATYLDIAKPLNATAVAERLRLSFVPPDTPSWEVSINGVQHSVITHRMDGHRIYEVEPHARMPVSELLGRISRATTHLANASGERELYAVMVREIQALVGFDRVMAYQFHADGHGQVVAEELTIRSTPMLGLHFPATDIPQQARRLYALQTSRLIADVDAVQHRLEPEVLQTTDRPLNMAFCELRSVSPIHIQYLKNMGVASSFSVSILADGELIGLIACHNHTAKRIDYRIRQGCEVLGRLVSESLAREQMTELRATRNRQLSMQVDLLCELSEERDVSAHSSAWRRAVSFVACDAALVEFDGERSTQGQAPDAVDELWALGRKLVADCPHACSSVQRLLDHTTVPGGLFVVPVGSRGWLGWYRRPSTDIVRWAGEPSTEDEKTLTPRASFDAWVDGVNGRCAPWSEADSSTGEVLRRGLAARVGTQEVDDDTFVRAMSQLREYTGFLEESNQALQRLNSDLSQYAHATAHDLRAPLRTVRSFLPLIRSDLGDALSPDAHQWLDYVRDAADTLHRLQEGLWAFSTIDRDSDHMNIDLNSVVQVTLNSLAADLEGVHVHVGSLPTVYGVLSQLETLFRNLVDNACKYRSPDRPLRIVIDSSLRNGEAVISVTNNGSGFPPQASERIFDLFSRVDPTRADGDGLGLALCRRIVHHHRGWISASSDPGHGSTFEFLVREPRGTT